MLTLAATTDKLQLVTDAAATVDVHASCEDWSATALTGSGKQNTAITTAATTDIVAAPAASTFRKIRTLFIRNKHATLAVAITPVFNQNGTSFELPKFLLLPGEAAQYIEGGVGFLVLPDAAALRLDVTLRVQTDVVNATTSFADVTGLTCPVEAGIHYNFLAHLYHVNNASTTGSRFGINGPAMTALQVGINDALAPAVSGGSTAHGTTQSLDTSVAGAVINGATGIRMAVMSGWINPSAAGIFAIRCQSEVAVAAGITVKAGSWLRLWRADN